MTNTRYERPLKLSAGILISGLLLWNVVLADSGLPDPGFLEFLGDGYADSPEFGVFVEEADQEMAAVAESDVAAQSEEGMEQ
ncbi:MAG: hypothetical protein ACR2P6_01035 [Gammaproteobacteria bacterium]